MLSLSLFLSAGEIRLLISPAKSEIDNFFLSAQL